VAAPPTTHGVLVVDKPKGPTSHDVVQWARRALSTRAVGHAGTLDPMATGVLVLAIGEATKLVPYLTADDKAYEAELALGAVTDTLDAEGKVTETAPVPALDASRVNEVLQRFVGRSMQLPPVFSAIKVDGVPLHERARRGEVVEAKEREVEVREIALLGLTPSSIRFSVRSAKGFYVRSLGRDIAVALGTVGHLVALRRTASGPFSVETALDGETLRKAREGDADARAAASSAVMSLEASVRALPRVVLDDAGEGHVRVGRALRAFDPSVVEGTPLALISSHGGLLAIGERAGAEILVRRGFADPNSTRAR
jgi:tRNA pseudouridine55 synthase